MVLTQAKGITGEIRNDMVKVLEEMIKYKLEDNENQVVEFLGMWVKIGKLQKEA